MAPHSILADFVRDQSVIVLRRLKHLVKIFIGTVLWAERKDSVYNIQHTIYINVTFTANVTNSNFIVFVLDCTALYLFQVINPYVLRPNFIRLPLDLCLAATALGSK